MASATYLFGRQAQAESISVEDYLRGNYDPDLDYVDGHLEERNLGEWEHARIQSAITSIFFQNEKAWQVRVASGARLQISETRFRVPDIMVLRADQAVARIVRVAPLLCVEVLSPGDTWRRMEEKIEDYLRLGVPNIWALDPSSREVFLCTQGKRQWLEAALLTLPETDVSIEVEQIFAAAEPS